MAGDWIKVEHALPDKREVVIIALALKIDQDEVVGKLIRFWIWAETMTADGFIAGIGSDFIDRHVRQDGFAQAMATVEWLIVTKKGLFLPNFERHNTEPAKKRALAALRAARHRLKKKETGETSVSPDHHAGGNASGNADRNPKHDADHNAGNALIALPEKRRVKKTNTPQPPASGRTSAPHALHGQNDEKVRAAAVRVYREYPHKIMNRRKESLEAIEAALLVSDEATLLAAVKKYASMPGLLRENGRFVPSAAKWFKQESWRDYVPQPAAPAVPVKPSPSEALHSVRALLELKRDLAANKAELTLEYVNKMTAEDDQFLTDGERERIGKLKFDAASKPDSQPSKLQEAGGA